MSATKQYLWVKRWELNYAYGNALRRLTTIYSQFFVFCPLNLMQELCIENHRQLQFIIKKNCFSKMFINIQITNSQVAEGSKQTAWITLFLSENQGTLLTIGTISP